MRKPAEKWLVARQRQVELCYWLGESVGEEVPFGKRQIGKVDLKIVGYR